EVVYIIKGKGKTQLFGPGEGVNSFDWQEGSLFAVPLNAPHKLVNTGSEPVFFLAVTTAPLVFDIFHNEKFIRRCDFEFTGRYAKAHHHGGGAVLLILRSKGYSLMWPNELGTQPFAQSKGERVVKVDWKVGSVFSPPTGWFHQHFNAGSEPALQLAFRNGSRI